MSSTYRIISELKSDEDDHTEDEEDNDSDDGQTAFEKLNSGVSTVQAFFKCRKFVQITKNERTVQRLNSELLSAIENDDLVSFNNCLNAGASINATCTGGGLNTCHVAILFDRCDLLIALLDKGADGLASTWTNNYLPVHLAAWNGCLRCLKILVERYPESISEQTTNIINDFKGNALVVDSWAHECESTSAKVPQMVANSTPLHVACKQLNVDCVQYLLSKQPELEMIDGRNMTALDVVNENIIDKKLEQLKGQCELFQKIGTSATDLRFLDPQETCETLTNSVMSLNSEESESCKKIIQIICLLIDAGAKFNIAEENRKNCTTILHTAILTQNETLTKILLKKNFDVTVRNELGDAPLHLAIRKCAKKCLILLLSWDEDGSTLEIKDYANRTPLQIAITPGWSYGVCLLIEAGANLNAVTDHGDNVLHLAASGKNPCVMDQLLSCLDINRFIDSRNADEETPLMVAVLSGNLDGTKMLIKFGAHLRITARNNRTLAHAAAEKGHLEILRLILNMDRALINAKTDDGETALHLASLEGHLDCVQLLLQKGCDIIGKTMKISLNKRPNFCAGIPDGFDFGGMPLHCAAWKGRMDVVKYLIEQDRSLVNEPNVNGWHPLHIAAYFNHVECTELIIKNGGNLYRKIVVPYFDGCFKTAIHIITYTFADPMGFFHNIFDSFITMDDLPLNHPECLVTFNFALFTPCGDDKKQMKVLNALLNTEQDDLQTALLLHPLTETFLHLKWQKLSKFFVYITVLYTIFTVSLTSFALLVRTEQMENWQAVPVFVMLFTLVLLSFQEILHASKLQRYYINDLESWIKWSTFLTAFIVSIGGINSMFNQYADTRWKNIIAIPVLLAWIEILFLLSRFPVWGFYVLMFFRVTSNVIKVFLTFASLILGFVFSFYILFKSNETEFYSIWETFIKVVAMMSEFNYSETFKMPEDLPPSEATIYGMVSRLVFLLFVVLIAIVLMNLMIGLAVSDITALEAQGKSQRLAKHIDFLHLLETFVYSRTLLKWLPEGIGERIKKNRKVSKTFSFYPGRPHGSELQKLPNELRKTILKYLLDKKNISGSNSPHKDVTYKDVTFYPEKKIDFTE
ncbi:transient receptor potential channel pyrexia-like [Planococcus citri]|uniref:transient receptor potential channel pyrexia-like n=1 Tax=Planococcus citri TaxID=170843 RepID=UPI0031F8BF09